MKLCVQIILTGIFFSTVVLMPLKASNFNPIEVTCTQLELTIEAESKKIVKCVCNRENVSEQIKDGSDFLINWTEGEVNEKIHVRAGYVVNNLNVLSCTRDTSFVTNFENYSQQLFITLKN